MIARHFNTGSCIQRYFVCHFIILIICPKTGEDSLAAPLFSSCSCHLPHPLRLFISHPHINETAFMSLSSYLVHKPMLPLPYYGTQTHHTHKTGKNAQSRLAKKVNLGPNSGCSVHRAICQKILKEKERHSTSVLTPLPKHSTAVP